MAKKTSKKPAPHLSLMSNPGGRPTQKKPLTKKSNPGGPIAKPPTGKATGFIRNPGPIANALLFAVGGAIALKSFDLGMAKLSPGLSTPITIAVKVGAGFAIDTYGRRYLGQWAGIAANALYLSAALSAWDQWVAPRLPASLTGAAAPITATQPIQNTATGQLGTRYIMADGNYADAFVN